jgi:hypothetical protein
MSIGNRRTDIIAFILMVSGGTFRMNPSSPNRTGLAGQWFGHFITVRVARQSASSASCRAA